MGGYSTRDPVSRHASARLIFLTLSSQTIALEPPQTSEEFESFVSYWVRRSAVLNPPGDSGQKLLPANLRKTQGLYVFCGRIWKHYRDESNKNSSNSTDGTAAKKPKIADSFEIAIENGWNKDEDLFIKYAKEGVKTGKPWSDFVNGTKGKNVPLGKFLT